MKYILHAKNQLYYRRGVIKNVQGEQARDGK